MSLLHALFLGIIEGITEFLPVSSTAHLILAGNLLAIPTSAFLKSFTIAIQLGAILAVVVLYAKRLAQSMNVCWKIVAAFAPTAIVGLLLHDVIKNVFFESTAIILWAMFLGGIALILFEQWHSSRSSEPRAPALCSTTSDLESISYTQAVGIGLAQAVAIIPGVSRAAATILGGLLLSLSRKTIVEFSFLLAVPTMLGATVLDLGKTGAAFTNQEWILLGIGFVTAFVTAILAIRWLLRFIQGHSFTAFGVYRIGAAAVLFVFLM